MLGHFGANISKACLHFSRCRFACERPPQVKRSTIFFGAMFDPIDGIVIGPISVGLSFRFHFYGWSIVGSCFYWPYFWPYMEQISIGPVFGPIFIGPIAGPMISPVCWTHCWPYRWSFRCGPPTCRATQMSAVRSASRNAEASRNAQLHGVLAAGHNRDTIGTR